MKTFLNNKKKSILAIGDQLIVSGTNFLSSLLMTRFIGLETYGSFVMFWMIFLFLQGIMNAYIGLPMQVLSSKRSNKENYLQANLRLANYTVFGICLLLYLGFYIYNVSWQETTFGYGFWLFPLLITLFFKHEINRKYFYAQEQIVKVLLIDSCTYLLQIPVLLFCCINYSIGLNEVVLSLMMTVLIGNVVGFLIKEKQSENQPEQLPILENWLYARYLISTALLQWFSGNFLLISAGGILGLSALGIVRILQNIMGVLHVLFLSLENVVPTKAAYLLHKHSWKHMITYLKKVTLVTGVFYAGLLLLLFVFGRFILSFLYGTEYAKYDYLLYQFIVVYLFVFIGTQAQIIIKTIGVNRGIFIAYLFSFIVAFISAIPLIETFGISGVIVGFGLLQITTITVYFFTLKKAWK